MEHFNMVFRFYWNIVFPFTRKRFQCFAIGKDVDPRLCGSDHFITFVNGKAGDQGTGQYQENTECFDMLKGSIYVFELCEHGAVLSS